MGKRDSFKLLASSSSSKDPLHTLVEEEEEDEAETPLEVETPKDGQVPMPSVLLDVEPVMPVPVADSPPQPPPPPSSRTRPTHLKLRPLSLTPENLGAKFHEHGLPTPPSTASSLKSSPSGVLKSFLCTNNGDDSATKNVTNNMRRLSLTPSPSLSSTTTLSADSPSPTPLDQDKAKRRSSISYKTSHLVRHHHGLPTPEATPTSENRQSSFSSISSLDDDTAHSRPLSASEQHFLFKSHQALLARINDLERGLALRNRPSSCTSDSSSHSSSLNGSEPTDEMLRLVADLKAERDELKRDVDGWRTRVNDLENHITIYAKRVEAERRDAWVARSRVTLLDVEKSALEKSLDDKTRQCLSAVNKCDHLKSECEHLRASLESMQVELDKTRELEEECCQLRTALMQEKTRREELQTQLRKMDPLATPTTAAFSTFVPAPAHAGPARTLTRGLGFESMDSESSTDVESFDDSRTLLKTVVEDAEAEFTDEEDELARYEDEGDEDMSFRSGSSFDSMDQIHREVSSTSSVPGAFRLGHHSRSSWSQSWTFPKAVQATPRQEEVDRFFNCLDDAQESPPLDTVSSYEDGKGMFSKAFMVDDEMNDDDMPPFLLPRNVGEEILDRPKSALEVLVEVAEEEEDVEQADEEEDDFSDGFEVGGIKITFTPPQADSNESYHGFSLDASLLDESAPSFGDENDENDSFNFGISQAESSPVKSVSPEATRVGASKHINTPSSIPRAVLFRTSPIVEPITPPRTSLGRFIPQSTSPASGLFTPPSKRGGTTPSFIPQPVSTPLRTATPAKQRTQPCATFIPQPPRKSTPDSNSTMHVAGAANGLSSKSQMHASMYALFLPFHSHRAHESFSQILARRPNVLPVDHGSNRRDPANKKT